MPLPPCHRESGSAEIDLETLKLTWLGLERAATHGSAPETYRPLADAVMGLIQWLRRHAGGATPGAWRAAGFETQERLWSGQEVRGGHAHDLQFQPQRCNPAATRCAIPSAQALPSPHTAAPRRA